MLPPGRRGLQRFNPQHCRGRHEDELETIGAQILRRLSIVDLADLDAINFYPRMTHGSLRSHPDISEPDFLHLPRDQSAERLGNEAILQIQLVDALERGHRLHCHVGIRPAGEAAFKSRIHSDWSRRDHPRGKRRLLEMAQGEKFASSVGQ